MNTEQPSRNQKNPTAETRRSSLGAHASSVPRVSDTGTRDVCAPRSPRRKILGSLQRIFGLVVQIRVHLWFHLRSLGEEVMRSIRSSLGARASSVPRVSD